MNFLQCDEEYKKIVAPIMSNEEFKNKMNSISAIHFIFIIIMLYILHNNSK